MPASFEHKGLIWLFIILVLAVFSSAIMFFDRNSPVPIQAGNQGYAYEPRKTRVYTVYYGLGVFSPTNIRIHAGDSVRFQNDGNAAIYIATDLTDGIPDLAGFDSVGDVPAGSVFTYTFDKAGIFGYHNARNPKEEGVVIVRP